MNVSTLDQKFMARAIEIAKKGIFSTDPNPRVGCVIVKDDNIIGEGWHEKAGEMHAEIMALESCNQSASGSTVYVTLEPCSHYGRTSPCCDALIKANVSRLFIAMKDPNPKVSGEGIRRMKSAGIHIELGLMEQESRELNPGFIKRMQTGLPWVICKMAMSLDGKTAMASGESQWITGKDSRQDIQLIRARSSAIITGSSTVKFDDPSMNARSEDFPDGSISQHQQDKMIQPWRVIMDSQLTVDPNSKIFKLPGQVIWATTLKVDESKNTERLRRIQISANARGKVSEKELLKWLAEQECNEVMIEAGARVTGAFINNDLVDRLAVYIAPKLLGDEARGLVNMPGIDKLSQAKQFKIVNTRLLGSDVCLTYDRIKK